MIPPFHDGTNLPEGIHRATLEDVEAFFGTSVKRTQLCASLRKMLNTARDCQFRKAILFGSFVSSKDSPGDIDLFWTLAPGTDTDHLHHRCRQLLDSANSKGLFMCDVFWCFDDDDSINRMSNMWQIDRQGRTRGLVMIDLH